MTKAISPVRRWLMKVEIPAARFKCPDDDTPVLIEMVYLNNDTFIGEGKCQKCKTSFLWNLGECWLKLSAEVPQKGNGGVH
jgi:hypothetical protein